MILTAHQCNLLPYSGVTDKARHADLFVSLTEVQFTRNNYHNRFALRGSWYTLSVNQKLEPLKDKVYRKPTEDWAAIKRRLAPHVHALSQFDDLIQSRLVDTNLGILSRLFEILGIDTKIVTDYPTALMRTERLVDLCTHYGATQYLSGPSGRDYLDAGLFERAGIEIIYQEPSPIRRAAIELVEEVL